MIPHELSAGTVLRQHKIPFRGFVCVTLVGFGHALLTISVQVFLK